MGINTGALLAPLVTGLLGERVGWHWGFASAGVGMLIGLITYRLRAPGTLGPIGLTPSAGPDEQRRVRTMTLIGVGLIFCPSRNHNVHTHHVCVVIGRCKAIRIERSHT